MIVFRSVLVVRFIIKGIFHVKKNRPSVEVIKGMTRPTSFLRNLKKQESQLVFITILTLYFRRTLFINAVIPKDFGRNYSMFPDNSYIKIEIKENKEDMEENNLKHSNFCKIGKNLRPFNLEEAKAGKPVCLRDGSKVRIICFERKSSRPIVALVTNVDNENEGVMCYNIDGYYHCKEMPTSCDLMMLPEKRKGWVNIYKGSKLDSDYLYPTKKDAINNIFLPMKARYIDTVKIEWEE